jgi:hypothetical protein
MLQLNDLLPPKQKEPNWIILGSEHEGLPDEARYALFEYYCDNPSCDCQNLVAVISRLSQEEDGQRLEKSAAIIEYDWSTKAKACRPKLHEDSPRTQLAEHLLKAYKGYVHLSEYMEHIKRDYAYIKKLSAEEHIKNNRPKINLAQKMGRNDPCECGSGKKYKKCCLKHKQF